MPAPALELRGIHKRFGSVQALRGADFVLMPGELHALLGENGAGKSTLMHIARGGERADAGTILVRDEPRALRSPRAGRSLGIAMVHQHFTLVPALSVAENVALAAGWDVAPRRLHRRVSALVERLGVSLDPLEPAGRLSVALSQRLEIVKALAGDTRILLLDEPTAALAPDETAELLGTVRAFTARGNSAVLITHKLDEALRAADRVTVLRRGQVTASGAANEHTPESLARAMMGDFTHLPRAPRPAARALSPVRVRCEVLDVPRVGGGRGGLAVRQASLVVHGGEIVAVAAVEGNGQRELLRAVAGVCPPLRGGLEVAAPCAFIPEDRTTEGLILELSLTENVVLGLGARAPWVSAGRINWTEARRGTAALMERFDVRAPDPNDARKGLEWGKPAAAGRGAGSRVRAIGARGRESGARSRSSGDGGSVPAAS